MLSSQIKVDTYTIIMEIYLVGGAVRDKILGLPIKEKDWVVVGATVEDMLNKGFRPVGKDFPVFLHPETYEEYALARTERKIGLGYKGFNFNASPHVSLEEDLRRRDLTINSIAEKTTGELIDPYHGLRDLENRILRHVSDAFVEDPVRILRVGRFAARFKSLGFTVAPETVELMRMMVKKGEVEALVAERVWKELERALKEENPEAFFQVLMDCEALPILFPELAQHRDFLDHLKKAALQTQDSVLRFAAMFSHQPLNDVQQFCERYRVPAEYRDFALLVSAHLSKIISANGSAETLLDLFQSTDAFRREERFKNFLTLSEIMAGIQTSHFLKMLDAAKKVDIQKLIAEGYSGKELADKIKQERINQLRSFL